MKGAKVVSTILFILGSIGLLLAAASPGLAAAGLGRKSVKKGAFYLPQAAISGTAFSDFDADGANDSGEPGIAGITVTAYDDSGAAVATATTAADGSYTLANLTSGEEYRIEFTHTFSGLRSGPQGADSHTSVVMITAPATDADAGFLYPADYYGEHPYLIIPTMYDGDPEHTSLNGKHSVVKWRYGGGSVAGISPIDKIGSVYGLAYARNTDELYAGAYLKRYVGLNEDDPVTGASIGNPLGIIYKINDAKNGTPTQELFFDVSTVPGVNVGTAPSNSARGLGQTGATVGDDAVYPLIGAVGLGDVDISDDETTLWTVSLNDKKLLAIPTNNPTASNVQTYNLPAPGCTGGEARPFALKYYRGRVYVGITCDASVSQNQSDLKSIVYRFDPGNSSFTTVLDAPLDYVKGYAHRDCHNNNNRWFPWVQDPHYLINNNLVPCPNGNGNHNAYPEPLLSDIEFLADGSMVLGFMDRFMDQVGVGQRLASDVSSSSLGELAAGGDVLRAAANGDGTFTLENNGIVGALTGQTNNNEGPGGGEFYDDEGPNSQADERMLGSLANLPGDGRLVIPRWSHGQVRDAYMHNNNGDYISTPTLIVRTSTFSKGNAVGDMELLGDPAPIEIGNRIWVDIDGDGIQDPGESPLANVTVVLKDDNGTVISTVTTNANGEYYFSSDPNRSDASNADYGIAELEPNTTGYTIEVDLSQSPLNGLTLTGHDVDSSPNGDARDSDAVKQSNVGVINVDTGPPGDNNHTYDIGFRPKVAIGNLVWHDANNNATVDSGEAGIAGIPVKLYRDTDGDGVLNPAVDALVDATTTDGNGYYQFLDVPPSTKGKSSTYYFVAVEQQAVKNAGYDYSSTGGAHQPDSTGDHDSALGDDGIPHGAYVISQAFPATVGGQQQSSQSDSGDPDDYYDDSAYMTVDFGFFSNNDNSSNAVTVRDISSTTNSLIWAIGFLSLALVGLTFFWMKRNSSRRK